MESKIPKEWNKFILKDVTFVNLMTRRIFNVLIVANPYDAFMLEDDGRVEEKIYNEYMGQHQSHYVYHQVNGRQDEPRSRYHRGWCTDDTAG